MNKDTSFDEYKRVLQWGLINNPFCDDRVIGHIIKYKNQIIASAYYIYLPFKFGDFSGIIPAIGSLCVHPDHQGVLGFIFSKEILKRDDYHIMVGCHFSKIAGFIWKKFGAIECPHSNLSFDGILSLNKKIDNAISNKNKIIGNISKLGLNVLLKPFFYYKGFQEIKCPLTTLTIIYPFNFETSHEEVINELCEHNHSNLNTGILRTADYLRWRYYKHPSKDQYHIFSVKNKDNTYIGLAILQLLPDTNEVRICELLYMPTVKNIEKELIYAVIMIAKKIGGVTIATRVICQELIQVWREIKLNEKAKQYMQFLILPKPYITRPEDLTIMHSYGEFKII